MTYTYRHPRPALTVDCVVFGADEPPLRVLLVRRRAPPFRDMWALPGGFVNVDEPLEEAARRELEEETGICGVPLEQFHTFGTPDRDPRERVVSVAHYALVNLRDHPVRAGSDAREAAWFPVREARGLAFDHDTILEKALRRLRSTVGCRPPDPGLLPAAFPLARLQRLYETVLERPLESRRFRTAMLRTGILEVCHEAQAQGARATPRLYHFKAFKPDACGRQGFLPGT